MERNRFLPDSVLVAAYRRGSSSAARELHSRYYPLIVRIVRGSLGDCEEARDLSQELCEKVFFCLLTRYRERGSLAGWICRVVRNGVSDHLRRASSLPSRSDADPDSLPSPPPFLPLERERALALLELFLSGLPEPSRRLLWMVYRDGMRYREVAAVLGLSRSGSHKRVCSLLSRLRALFLEHGISSCPEFP